MKKVLYPLIAAVLLTVLVASACGGGGSTAVESAPAAVESAAKAAEAPAPTETPEPTATPVPTPLPTVDPSSGGSTAECDEKFSDGLMWFKDASGLYGYIGTDGITAIEPQYEAALPFKDGYAVVSYGENGLLHDIIIDTAGNTVVGNLDSGKLYVDYDLFEDFENLPSVEVCKAQGQNVTTEGFNYLSKDGTLLTEDKYMYVGAFHDGFALVGAGKMKGKSIFIRTTFGESNDLISGDTYESLATSYYYIDRNGNKLSDETWVKAGVFSDGLASVAKKDGSGDLLWGYINASGEQVIDCKYSKASPFAHGFAVVCLDGNYLLIDQTGREYEAAAKFDRIYFPGSTGYARVSSDNMMGLIDKDGKVLVQPEYSTVNYLPPDMAVVERKDGDNGKWGIIGFDGSTVVDLVYDSLVVGESVIVYGSEGKFGIMTRQGEIITEPVWDSIGSSGSKLLSVESGGKFGFIDISGNPVRECEFDSVGPFGSGAAVVKKDGVWFIMDEAGNIL